ncbi:MAG TPA: response regulator, partial [Candidatus Acidoferrales bacterium]|nr:response regulator [Candidatus Acidoferrales bacterium]
MVAVPGDLTYDPLMPNAQSPLKGSILVAEDEAGVRDSLTEVLRDEGYQVQAFGDGSAAITALESQEFDLVISDIRMPGADGLAVLRRAREIAPQTLVLLMTAHATVETAVEAIRRGAQDYLLKPIIFDDLLHKIDHLLQHRQITWEYQMLRSQVEQQWDF